MTLILVLITRIAGKCTTRWLWLLRTLVSQGLLQLSSHARQPAASARGGGRMRPGHALAGADILPALPRPLVQSGERTVCFTLQLEDVQFRNQELFICVSVCPEKR